MSERILWHCKECDALFGAEETQEPDACPYCFGVELETDYLSYVPDMLCPECGTEIDSAYMRECPACCTHIKLYNEDDSCR